MRNPPFSNWNDSAASYPARVATPQTVTQLVAIVQAPDAYPSPVRAAGHLHSMNECFATDGTQVFLYGEYFRRCVFNPADDTITVGASASLLDIARVLEPYDRQLPVAPEIGNATAGSVACCGTKDSSFGNGPGQVSSTVVAVKMVKANGSIETVDVRQGAEHQARMHKIRSSYGLLGILYEVTFRTEPRAVARYDYHLVDLSETPPIHQVHGGADSVLGFMQPYSTRILVERRTLTPGYQMTALDRKQIAARSYAWERLAAMFAEVAANSPFPGTALDYLDQTLGTLFQATLSGFHASRADCMIDFEKQGPYFDFTFWAFPISRWTAVVPAYLQFVKTFRHNTGFRASLFTEVYFIKQDNSSLLSFSAQEDVFTLDVVDHRPNDSLWRRLNREFNAFAVDHGGCPLLNQTKELLADPNNPVVQKTLGARWNDFKATAKLEDSGGRFLNSFFAAL